jgi:hypothetical protein
MMNELMLIQKELGQAPQPRPMRRADPDDEQRPDDGYDPLDWLASPVDHSRFHVGYTTNHWLEVCCYDRLMRQCWLGRKFAV